MLLFDGHLDLAMNAMEWNRDLRQSLGELRRREQGQTDKPDRGNNVVSFPEMRRGHIGLCVATQMARHVNPGSALSGCTRRAWRYHIAASSRSPRCISTTPRLLSA